MWQVLKVVTIPFTKYPGLQRKILFFSKTNFFFPCNLVIFTRRKKNRFDFLEILTRIKINLNLSNEKYFSGNKKNPVIFAFITCQICWYKTVFCQVFFTLIILMQVSLGVNWFYLQQLSL